METLDLESMNVAELRKIATSQSIGSGVWRVGASKADLISALRGEYPVSCPVPSNPPAASTPIEKTYEPSKIAGSGSDLAKMLATAIADFIPPQQATVSADVIRAMIRAELSSPPKNHIYVKTSNGFSLDRQHKNFALLLHRMKCRTHTWLVGPAGSGKTTAAENVARELGLPFYFTGAIDNEYKLTGFIDAQGRYVSKQFRQAYECGGVFLFDEIDASLPPAVLAFNAALANSTADFPDGAIKRHADFVCIAASNTWAGPTSEYNGRTKQDASTLDRFARMDWGYDEELETAIVSRMFPDQNKWVAYVQKVRANCSLHGIQHIVSPRASIEGAKSQANGGDWADDVRDFIRKGLNDSLWAKVSGE